MLIKSPEVIACKVVGFLTQKKLVKERELHMMEDAIAELQELLKKDCC